MFVPISPELSSAFGTPVLLHMASSAVAMNYGLERAVLTRAQRGLANRISNVGGWQSLPDVLDWPEPEIKQLANEMDRAIQQISAMPAILGRQTEPPQRVKYNAYGWANLNQPGDYNMIHLHSGNHWSVVYYVATGTLDPETPTNRRIELRDPRPAATFGRLPGFTCGQPLLIRPQPGMLMVFPSWIEHCVHPFYGAGHRISIALNIKLEDASAT